MTFERITEWMLNGCKRVNLPFARHSFSIHVLWILSLKGRVSWNWSMIEITVPRSVSRWIWIFVGKKGKRERRKKRPKKNDEPDDPDVRINYANVNERLSGTRWLFRLGNIYIGYCVDTRLREVNLFFSFFKGRILLFLEFFNRFLGPKSSLRKLVELLSNSRFKEGLFFLLEKISFKFSIDPNGNKIFPFFQAFFPLEWQATYICHLASSSWYRSTRSSLGVPVKRWSTHIDEREIERVKGGDD